MCGKPLQALVELSKAMYAGMDTTGQAKEQVQEALEKEMRRIIEKHGINPLIGMPGACADHRSKTL